MKKIFCIILVCQLKLFCQTPSVDPSWQLIFSDDFNTLDQTKWDMHNNMAAWGATTTVILGSNTIVQNGELVLTAKRENNYICPSPDCSLPSYQYSGAFLSSKNGNFYYGYYETRAKMDFISGFFPAIWLINTGNAPHYSEIDICEIVGSGSRRVQPAGQNYTSIMNNYQYTSNLHGAINAADPHTIGGVEDYLEIGINDYTQYHVYGLDWQPNKMSFYIDDQLVRVSYPKDKFNTSYNQFDEPMTMLFDAKIMKDVEVNNMPYHITPDYPAKMYVDYFRYYQLKGNCTEVVNAQCYDFNTHTDNIKQVINLGNSCYNTVPPGKNYIFRSSSYIELKDQFYVPLGSEFLADCNEFCVQPGFDTHNCNFIFNPCNYDFSGYQNTVKQTIEISGNQCSATVLPVNNVKLYATEYIDLKEGFSVPLGSEIEIKTTPCP